MKKVLAFILAFVYLSSSMGATIHLHYCMGKLESWSLIDHGDKNYSRCGILKKTSGSQCLVAKTCCKDVHKQIKTDKDQKLFPSEFFKDNDLSQAVALNKPALQGLKVFSFSIEYPNSNAPPLFGNSPLFVLYRNLRL